jgi:hypothetical protein
MSPDVILNEGAEGENRDTLAPCLRQGRPDQSSSQAFALELRVDFGVGKGVGAG